MDKTTLASTWIKNVKGYLSEHRVEMVLLLVILVVGAFLRLYKISGYMTFLGDEGRDMMVVRRLLVERDLIFVGPGTSVGNMYLGPFYYYLIAPFLWLFNFSPVGPSVMVALFGVATVFLVWYVVAHLFPAKKVNWGALFAALFYAVAPTVIILSHSSWNPNIMPFFALLVVFSLWKVWQEKRLLWLIPLGIFYAIVLQSHYLGLILLPFIAVFWIATFFDLLKEKGKKLWRFVLATGGLITSFVLLMSPLILFDAHYNWRNIKSMQLFFTQSGSNLSFNLLDLIRRIPIVFNNVFVSLMSAREGNMAVYVALPIIFLFVWFLFINRQKFSSARLKGYFFIFTWFVFGILGFTFYRQPIYDHYFGFLFPAPFILLGAFVQDIYFSGEKWIKLCVPLLVVGILLPSILNIPLKQAPNYQLRRSINVARKIVDESGGESFNLAVIADRNYEGAYQYFLELWQAPLLMIDPQKYGETLAEQLFVVCEYEDQTKCQPTSNPKAEVANFGWSKVDKSWNIDGLVLFRLIHTKM
jgi:4-amino-4-deoxy-L-arabinose transferase-like glycosyltransferase